MFLCFWEEAASVKLSLVSVKFMTVASVHMIPNLCMCSQRQSVSAVCVWPFSVHLMLFSCCCWFSKMNPSFFPLSLLLCTHPLLLLSIHFPAFFMDCLLSGCWSVLQSLLPTSFLVALTAAPASLCLITLLIKAIHTSPKRSCPPFKSKHPRASDPPRHKATESTQVLLVHPHYTQHNVSWAVQPNTLWKMKLPQGVLWSDTVEESVKTLKLCSEHVRNLLEVLKILHIVKGGEDFFTKHISKQRSLQEPFSLWVFQNFSAENASKLKLKTA